MSTENNNKKPGYGLALAATLLAVVVVGLGAYTRLVHAGLGCPDWPGCYGFLTVPQTASEIQQAEALFPDAPVETAKGWAEMVHRYVAGSLLILVLALAINAVRNRKQPGQPVKLPLFILGLIILQAAFGMWTVTLKLWPQIVTAHLLGGFATLTLLALLTLRLSGRFQPRTSKPLKTLAAAGLVVVIAQITLGGWTSSNYAALACPDFPECQGELWPDMNMQAGFDIAQQIGPNYLGGQLDNEARIAIHMTHRLGAIVVLLLVGALAARGLRRPEPDLNRASSLILAALAVQLALGLSNIVFHLPLGIAVAHNLGGALLLVAVVFMNERLRYQQITTQQ